MPSKPTTCPGCGGTKKAESALCRPCADAAKRANGPGPNPEGLCSCGCGEPTPLAKRTSATTLAIKGQPLRFVPGHQRRKHPTEYEPEDRGFPAGKCWIWKRAVDTHGYGVVVRAGHSIRAHRLVYERHVGPIPDGLDLDHLCRVRDCVNPTHLEPVSRSENIARGEGAAGIVARTGKCLRGHPFSGDNLYVSPSGSRHCRACGAGRARERRRREAAA